MGSHGNTKKDEILASLKLRGALMLSGLMIVGKEKHLLNGISWRGSGSLRKAPS